MQERINELILQQTTFHKAQVLNEVIDYNGYEMRVGFIISLLEKLSNLKDDDNSPDYSLAEILLLKVRYYQLDPQSDEAQYLKQKINYLISKCN